MNTTRLISTLLVAAAVGGAAAGTASADSVAYVKDGNVYLAPGDLSREFQVTSTGGYSAVSQADDGTLLATAGGDLVRMDRYGNVLSDIKTPVSDAADAPLDKLYGPFNADISPDGTKAAYGFVHDYYSVSSDGYDFEERNGAGFTSSTALTGFTDPGYTYSTDWDAPEWIDNQTVLLSNGPGYPSNSFAVETVGSGDPQSWFSDPDNPHPLDATISRDKRAIAAVVGPDRQKLTVYHDAAGLMSTAYACFTYSDGGAYKYESPTFNGNETRLYWSNGTNLQSAPIADMSAGCASGQAGAPSFTGTSPDWGPADVPTSRPAAPAPAPAPAPTPAPAPAPHHPGTVHHRSHPSLSLLRHGRLHLAAGLHHGVALHVHAPATGPVTVTAFVRHTRVAGGRVRARHAGRVTVHLRFTSAARRRYARVRHLTLRLTVTQRGRHATGHLTLAR